MAIGRGQQHPTEPLGHHDAARGIERVVGGPVSVQPVAAVCAASPPRERMVLLATVGGTILRNDPHGMIAVEHGVEVAAIIPTALWANRRPGIRGERVVGISAAAADSNPRLDTTDDTQIIVNPRERGLREHHRCTIGKYYMQALTMETFV